MSNVPRFVVMASVMVLLQSLTPSTTQACPACNINNYLAATVRVSSDIYVARTELGRDGKPVGRRVLSVIRGKHKPGDLLPNDGRTWHDPALFLDTSSIDVEVWTYQPAWFESEVRRLAKLPQRDPNGSYGGDYNEELEKNADQLDVKTVDDAVACLAGISVITREAGLRFLERNRTEGASEAIIKAIKALDARDDWLATYGQYGLMKGLVIVNDPPAMEFLVRQVPELIRRPGNRWKFLKQPAFNASEQAEVVAEILAAAQKHEGVAARLNEDLRKTFPTLEPEARESAVFAVVASDSIKAEAVDAWLGDSKYAGEAKEGIRLARRWKGRPPVERGPQKPAGTELLKPVKDPS